MKANVGNTSSNGGTPQPPVSQQVIGEVHLNNPSPRDHLQRNSQFPIANDYPQQQRNSFRRNAGQHSRGDGPHHHNYGGRREHDRTNQAHRNFNNRDAHMQPQRLARFIRHPPPPPAPPTATPFIGSPAARAFSSPIGFPGKLHYILLSLCLCGSIYINVFHSFNRIVLCCWSTSGPSWRHAFCCSATAASCNVFYYSGASIAF